MLVGYVSDEFYAAIPDAGVEFRGAGFVLRAADLEGESASSLELKDGDRFHLGSLELQFTLEARD